MIVGSGGFGPGSANGAREAAKPVSAGGEDDVADASCEARAGRSVGVAEGAIAQQGLGPTPLAARSDARAQVSSGLSGAGAVAPFLRKHILAAQDGRAGATALGSGRFLGDTDP